jgi:hypothetical protein
MMSFDGADLRRRQLPDAIETGREVGRPKLLVDLHAGCIQAHPRAEVKLRSLLGTDARAQRVPACTRSLNQQFAKSRNRTIEKPADIL